MAEADQAAQRVAVPAAANAVERNRGARTDEACERDRAGVVRSGHEKRRVAAGSYPCRARPRIAHRLGRSRECAIEFRIRQFARARHCGVGAAIARDETGEPRTKHRRVNAARTAISPSFVPFLFYSSRSKFIANLRPRHRPQHAHKRRIIDLPITIRRTKVRIAKPQLLRQRIRQRFREIDQ